MDRIGWLILENYSVRFIQEFSGYFIKLWFNIGFDIEKEIITYKETSDCIEKIKWLLSNPNEANTIRQSGKIAATSKHSWDIRFTDVFRFIGLLK